MVDLVGDFNELFFDKAREIEKKVSGYSKDSIKVHGKELVTPTFVKFRTKRTGTNYLFWAFVEGKQIGGLCQSRTAMGKFFPQLEKEQKPKPKKAKPKAKPKAKAKDDDSEDDDSKESAAGGGGGVADGGGGSGGGGVGSAGGGGGGVARAADAAAAGGGGKKKKATAKFAFAPGPPQADGNICGFFTKN